MPKMLLWNEVLGMFNVTYEKKSDSCFIAIVILYTFSKKCQKLRIILQHGTSNQDKKPIPNQNTVLDKLMRIKLNTLSYDTADLSNAYQNWLDISEKRGRYNIGLPVKKPKLVKSADRETEGPSVEDDSNSKNDNMLHARILWKSVICSE